LSIPSNLINEQSKQVTGLQFSETLRKILSSSSNFLLRANAFILSKGIPIKSYGHLITLIDELPTFI